jgi:hypothetical protein
MNHRSGLMLFEQLNDLVLVQQVALHKFGYRRDFTRGGLRAIEQQNALKPVLEKPTQLACQIPCPTGDQADGHFSLSGQWRTSHPSGPRTETFADFGQAVQVR